MEFKKFASKPISIFLAVLSGCIIGISMPGYNLGFLAWIGLIPLFIALTGKNLKQAFALGFIAGFTHGLWCSAWALHSVPVYMGRSITVGILVYLVLAIFFALWFGFFGLSYSFLTSRYAKKQKFAYWFYFLSIPAVWITFEFIIASIFFNFPWLFFFLGYSQWLYPQLIQFAKIGGVFGVSFLIVLFNYSIFLAIKQKNYKLLIPGGSVFFLSLLVGMVIIHFNTEDEAGFIVTILHENIPPEVKWNDATADSLVEKYYLGLNREAVKHNPDLILWSETAIPWTISLEDDLIYEALNITYPIQAGHILGISSPVPGKPNKVYNSAFYVQPDGAITSQYNKTIPLAFVEIPALKAGLFRGFRLPMFTSAYRDVEPGKNISLLRTPNGNAGMNICNEITLSNPARKAVKKGANFLMVMSNDSWFTDTVLTDAHMSGSVFRSVENSRYLAVSSNGGIAGFIAPNGVIKQSSTSDKPECLTNTMVNRSNMTFYTKYGDLFSYFCIILFVIGIAMNIWQSTRQKPKKKRRK